MKYTNFTYSSDAIEPITDIIVEDYEYNCVEIYVKLPTTRLRIAQIFKYYGKLDEKTLKIIDDNISIVLENRSLLNKALDILSNNTDFYGQVADNITNTY